MPKFINSFKVYGGEYRNGSPPTIVIQKSGIIQQKDFSFSINGPVKNFHSGWETLNIKPLDSYVINEIQLETETSSRIVRPAINSTRQFIAQDTTQQQHLIDNWMIGFWLTRVINLPQGTLLSYRMFIYVLATGYSHLSILKKKKTSSEYRTLNFFNERVNTRWWEIIIKWINEKK